MQRSFNLILGLLPALYGTGLLAQPAIDNTLDMFLAKWSNGPGISAQDVQDLYAPHVRYYGHMVTREEVLRQKRSIARRWPDRVYQILPHSTAGRCNAERSACNVTGVLNWSVKSASRGINSAGGATLNLELARYEGRLQIVAETGRLIARRHCRVNGCKGFANPALN